MNPWTTLMATLLPVMVLYLYFQFRNRMHLSLVHDVLLHTMVTLLLYHTPVEMQGHSMHFALIPLAWIALKRGLAWMTLPALPVALLHWPDLNSTLLLIASASILARTTSHLTWKLCILSLPALFPQNNTPALTAVTSYFLHLLALWVSHRTAQQTQREQTQRTLWQNAAHHDPLTALGNHRKLELDRPHFQPGCFLVMLDIDHFKHINDTYGHPTGDEVLKTLSGTLRLHTRTEDFLYRLGGEEFLVVLNLKDPQQATQVTERLRSAITATIQAEIHEITHPVTVSAGLSVLQGDFDSAIKEADQQLYKAKQSGRNRLVTGQDHLTTPHTDILLSTQVLDCLIRELHLDLEVQDALGNVHFTLHADGQANTSSPSRESAMPSGATLEDWQQIQLEQIKSLQSQQSRIAFLRVRTTESRHLVLVRMVPFETRGGWRLLTVLEKLQGSEEFSWPDESGCQLH